MTKPNRKKITDLLLRERLGLDEDWESFIPHEFPPELRKLLDPADLRDLERELRKLVDAGCREDVLWLCLEQLVRAPAGKSPATREDLKALRNTCKKASTQIHRYFNELSLVAEVVPEIFPAPTDDLCPFSDAVNALVLLRRYLYWIERLTQAWETPEMQKVMKNKSLLFLGIYVECVVPAGRRRECEHSVEAIGGYFSPSSASIRNSVTKFRSRYRREYRQLYSKLKVLHSSCE